jgi:hypothetical protein
MKHFFTTEMTTHMYVGRALKISEQIFLNLSIEVQAFEVPEQFFYQPDLLCIAEQRPVFECDFSLWL